MDDKKPIIGGFVADLMFTMKIENVARHAGFDIRWLAESGNEDGGSTEGLGERLNGRLGQLFQTITQLQPALLLFDLENSAVPWEQWISAFKTSPATRRIPILCFGSHRNVEQMKRATEVGANQVVARSKFVADMAALFHKHAQSPDTAAIEAACAQPLSPDGLEGIALFNAGAYYPAHDAFEKAWMEDESVGRDLYRLLLQTAVCLYQIERGNYRGAMKMLLRLRRLLAPLPSRCRGVNIAELTTTIVAIDMHVQALGTDDLSAFDWTMVNPIEVN